jgi:hypothetical protein
LTFTPDVEDATLSIDGDTTGFLAAVKVAAGTTRARINPDAAFNATGADAPHFDPGYTVQAGSFTVNGVAIDVAADDTVNSVLAKISASSAGVTAAYDAATEQVALTSVESGSPIVLGPDTSGFLAALKLDATARTSVSIVDRGSAYSTAIGQMTDYAGVTAGTLTVNGQDVDIDPASTTISGLVETLNGLTGVAASLDPATGRLNLSSRSGGSLVLSDTSGILAALGIDAGTYAGRPGSPTTTTVRTGAATTSNAFDVAAKVESAVARLNETLEALGDPEPLRRALDRAVDALRDHGIRGLAVAEDGEKISVSVARNDLAGALDAIPGGRDLARELTAVFDRLGAEIDAAGSKTAPPVQSVRLDTMSRAQLMADQTATSLLFLKSSLQPQERTATKEAMKAYAETA